MKKKCIFAIMLLVFLPLKIEALTGGLSISCDKNVVAGQDVKCIITASVDDIIGSFSTKVLLSNSDVTVKEFIPNDKNVWQYFGMKNDKVTLNGIAQDYISDKKITIGTLVLNVGNSVPVGTVKVELTDVAFSDKDDNDIINGLSGSSTTFSVIQINDVNTNDHDTNNVDSSNNTKKDNSSVSESNLESNTDLLENELYLDNLIIEKHDIVFDKEKLNYIVEIAEEEYLNIIPVINDSSIGYEIKGNDNLVDGSVISIVLNDENDNTKTYTITISKKNNKVNESSKKRISLIFYIIIGILIIINIVRFLLSIKRKNNNQDNQ